MHGPGDVAFVRRVLLVKPDDACPRVVVLGSLGHVGERAQLEVVVALAFLAAQRRLAKHVVQDALCPETERARRVQVRRHLRIGIDDATPVRATGRDILACRLVLNDDPRAVDVDTDAVQLADDLNAADRNHERNIRALNDHAATGPPRHVAAHEGALERLFDACPRLRCLAAVKRAERAVYALARLERLARGGRLDPQMIPVVVLSRASPEAR
jgi:hypothetical protein